MFIINGLGGTVQDTNFKHYIQEFCNPAISYLLIKNVMGTNVGHSNL